MYKNEVLMYLKESTKLPAKETLINGDGTAKLLSDILGVTEVAVCNFKEIIPFRRALQLERTFSDSEKLEEYGLPDTGMPELDLNLYE